jgi:RNA polymerase sigma-70 factor (ECF subfamily)
MSWSDGDGSDGSGDPSSLEGAALRGLAEADCLLLALAGNRNALGELARRYTPGVYHLLHRLLGPGMAADATQEVFLRLQRGLGGFDRRRSFRAWLFAIAWNLARDLLRRRSRRRETLWVRLGGEQGDRGPRSAAAPLDIADPRAAAPFDILERREERRLVQKALERLAPPQRALLVLREFEGLSHEELAALLCCRVGTVKSRLHRARLQLKDELVALEPSLARKRGE